MLSRLTKWVVPAVFGVFMAAPASFAVPMVPAPGPNVILPNEQYTYHALLGSNEVIGAPNPNGLLFLFNVAPQAVGSTSTATALDIDPPAQGSDFGVANLTLTWMTGGLAPIASYVVTDNFGSIIDATASLALTLFAPGPYYLSVMGTALANGGDFSILLRTGPARAVETPLPPAVILFGSALVGLMMLKRRRSRRATEFAAA